MTYKTGRAALLLSALGVAEASENPSGLAGKRDLSPVIITRILAFLAGLFCTSIALAANPLPPDQATELGKLYQTYSVDSQAAIAAHKQAELQQTEIVTQQARVVELQGKADRTETELGELQEFDRKKPGKVKPEEMETARSKHLQAQAGVEAAQHQFEQQLNKLTQLKEDLSKKNLATENSITIYRTRFAAFATEAVARRVNGYKVAQQITESANVACEDLPISACKTKTQQEVQRRAIEKGAIIVVDSITEIKNLTLQKDEVRSEVHGEISNLKILETRLTDEPATFFMKIQATVTPVIGDSLLEEIQRTVLSDMSLQMSDGGLAFKSPESMILSPMEAGAILIMPSTYKKKEFAPLLKKAQAGDAQAQYEIAVLYQYGLGSVKVDKAKATAWYEKAVAQNHTGAQAKLAFLYVFDIYSVAKEDLPKGIALLGKSAEIGDTLAQLFLPIFNKLKNDNSFDQFDSEIDQNARRQKIEAEFKILISNALPALEKLAQRGDPFAQWFIAAAYLGMKDETKAIMWLERAAPQGNVYAQTMLAEIYKAGTGVAKNEAKAFEWVQKAALQDFPNAQSELGDMYQEGVGVVKNNAKAFEWQKKAAFHGDAYAQYSLGWRYKNGEGVAKNKARAFEWFEKAAIQGKQYAQQQLGEMYEKGVGVKKDEGTAFDWYEKAARQGNNKYEFIHLGQLSEKLGYKGAAFEWYEKAALRDDRDSQYSIGMMYLNGEGVAKDEAKAFEWIEKAALHYVGKARLQLGLMYKDGIGVAKNEAKAFEWIYRAALLDKPDKDALFYLGVMYDNGIGVAKDKASAFYYFEKGALLGSVVSQFNLGISYLHGDGVAKNSVAAVNWFEKSANQGYTDAQYMLGLSYLLGNGVQKDPVLGYAWLNLAAAQGYEEAKKTRDEMTLTASQRAEAERLSSNWKPGKPIRRAKK